MTFQWPNAFWLLLLPAAFALAEVFRRVRASVRRHPKIMRAEASPSGLRLLRDGAATPPEQRVRWRLWLGLAMAAIAFARPQWGEVEEPVFEQSREILIAVDLSRSMLAPDVAPSRLDRSKLLITSLLEKLAGERVGLLVFAGTSFLQSPLSSDYEILREFLPALNPDYLPEGGTDYAALLDAALDAFSKDSGADRYLIILSDGESQTDAWEQRVDDVREREIHILGLGIGTAAGAMLPDGAGGFVKDERGAVVLSRLNPATLEDLARRTGGVYRDASSWVDLAELLQQTVETGRQGDFAETRRARRIERFQWALAPALLLLLWSVWREFPVQPRLKAVTIKTAKTAARVTVIALFASLLFQGPRLIAVEKVSPGTNRVEDPNHIMQVLPEGADAAAEPPPPEAPVRELVGRLAGQSTLSATDYAELATETLTYGQQIKGAGEKVQPSVVHDALDGVDAGEALNANAADWPALRAALKQLLENDPDQQKQDQDNQDDSEDKQDQKDGDKGQKGKDGDKGDQDQDSSGKDGDKGEQGQDGDQGDQQKDGENGEQQKDQSDQQDQEGKDGEPQDNQEPAGQDNQPDKEHKPPENRESAFGDLDEPQEQPKPDEGQQPQPQPQPRDPGTQTVGGQPTRNTEAADNPALAMPLQKLDQLKQQDSPAQLFQLMQDPANATPKVKGRDW